MKKYLFTAILSLYFTLIFNIPFWAKVKEVLTTETQVKVGFVLSIPILLFFIFFILFQLVNIHKIFKPLFIILTLVSSLLTYTSYEYGTIFDTGMVESIFETTAGEAKSYFNFSVIIWFIISGLIPTYLIYKTPVRTQTFLREFFYRVSGISVSIAAIFVIGSLYYQDYASIGRNHHGLQKEIIPVNFLVSNYKYVKQKYFTHTGPFEVLGQDATIVKPTNQTKPNVLVFILGETARSQNISYNGYNRDTAPYTKKYPIVSFSDTHSCGTYTALSVPCMFSRLDRRDYDKTEAYNQSNAIDILKTAGINLFWFDNDGGCKGVCNRIDHEKINIVPENTFCDQDSCRDESLLAHLDQKIDDLKGKDSVIFLHLIGSHGPTYFNRYPKSEEFFTPACNRSDIQNCSQQEIKNTYDNTLRYTDKVIAQTIEKLKNRSDINTAMLYLSDHGESLGEDNVYLHGLPYGIAPIEQRKVPFYLWMSDDFEQENNIDYDCLQSIKDQQISHDNLFDTLLGIMNVQTSAYQKDLDIIKTCRTHA